VIAYLDSSALVAVYVTERFSKVARALARSAGQVPFTALHELEVRNGFELLRGRRLITIDEWRAIVVQLQEDLEQQRLVRVSLDLDRVFIEAAELSRLHAARFLARSLNLLHVAAARAASCTEFVSADDRQLAVAKSSGLTAIDVKRPSRRTRQR
jgi:predicted nucleic acid-binding protein